MASTNEDAVVLATARFDDGRLLAVRHRPDRGMVEVGWWGRDGDGAIAQLPPALELAAEAAEVEVFARLCERAAATGWDTVGDGEEIAAAGPFADGARLVVLRASDEVAFARRPEAGDLVRVPRAMLERLVAETLPAALGKLVALGFGLPQHGDEAALNQAIDFWSE
jgi:hypothetical protein